MALTAPIISQCLFPALKNTLGTYLILINIKYINLVNIMGHYSRTKNKHRSSVPYDVRSLCQHVIIYLKYAKKGIQNINYEFTKKDRQ